MRLKHERRRLCGLIAGLVHASLLRTAAAEPVLRGSHASFQVYYINMAASRDRRACLIRQFAESCPFPVQRFEAVAPQCDSAESCTQDYPDCAAHGIAEGMDDLKDDWSCRNRSREAARVDMLRGKLGNWCSFGRVFRLAARGAAAFAVVFEDDVVISPEFFTTVQDFATHYGGAWDMVQIDPYGDVPRSPAGAFRNGSVYDLSKPRGSFWGAHATLVRVASLPRISGWMAGLPATPTDLAWRTPGPGLTFLAYAAGICSCMGCETGIPYPAYCAVDAINHSTISGCAGVGASGEPRQSSNTWPWFVVLLSHAPYLVLLVFLVFGLAERIGYFVWGRAPEPGGTLPRAPPKVCVQLPMFNEALVASRCIQAACRIRWPRGRLLVQVLDDSTDPDARSAVDAAAERARRDGADCQVVRRTNRKGYKAGALEEGRKMTDAEFIAILDADFVATPDFLEQAVPHFFTELGSPLEDLAMVQTQWGHLNHASSLLTLMQSLWVDDHHTLQMSFRSSKWSFVNFTGTAGIWRAAAIEKAGGWRSDSLVEDCELSFRSLFAGYYTKFVKEIVQPAELPDSYTAYKAQQKRWTQGWAQLIRLHWRNLLRFDCGLLRKGHLFYHMLISIQWPIWGLWIVLMPWLVTFEILQSLTSERGMLLYSAPLALWLSVMSVLASFETRHTYNRPGCGGHCGVGEQALDLLRGAVPRHRHGQFSPVRALLRVLRVLPYIVVNMGMLPHQVCSFLDGFFVRGGEFEKTPKTGGKKGTSAGQVKIHWYVYVEAAYFLYQLAWCAAFCFQSASQDRHRMILAVCAGCQAASVAFVAFFYKDHVPGSHSYDCASPTNLCDNVRSKEADTESLFGGSREQ